MRHHRDKRRRTEALHAWFAVVVGAVVAGVFLRRRANPRPIVLGQALPTEAEASALVGYVGNGHVARATRLQQAGYEVATRSIDAAVTPKNRLLLAAHAPEID